MTAMEAAITAVAALDAQEAIALGGSMSEVRVSAATVGELFLFMLTPRRSCRVSSKLPPSDPARKERLAVRPSRRAEALHRGGSIGDFGDP